MSPFTPTIAPARPRTSPFTSPAGVEAWDAWFRWRDATGLRDLTVDATWARVASALVPRSGDGHLEVDRYRRAFADWRLLPDPVLLRRLGTGGPAWSTPELTAVVNVAACVQSPATPQAALDEDSLAFATRLAARLLDDAAATVHDANDAPPACSIGVIGLGDAIAMLGLRYDSVAGRAFAGRAARVMALAAFEAAVALAEERGSRVAFDPARAPASAAPALLERAQRSGLRCAPRIAVRSQRELALFANGVSDALDPVGDEGHVHRIDSPQGERRIAAAGPALVVRREREAAGAALPPIDTARDVDPSARERMREAFEAEVRFGLPAPAMPAASHVP